MINAHTSARFLTCVLKLNKVQSVFEVFFSKIGVIIKGQKMKHICVFISLLTCLYLAGELILQNATLAKVVHNIEDKYKSFNDFIKDSLVRDLLIKLSRFAKIITLFTFTIFLFISNIYHNLVKDLSFLLYLLLGSFYVWLSISWVLNHKIEVSKLIHKELILFVLTPIVILFLDYIMGSNNLLILDDIIKGQFKLTNIIDPNDSLYKVKIALMYTLSIIAIILVYYILIWLITFPIFIFIFLIFKSIIQLSKMIDKLFPKKPLVGIAVILFVLSNLYLYYS